MSSLEYHVLLALAGGPLHGYAVKQDVEDESAGSLTPQPGSLCRVIARLTGNPRWDRPRETREEA
jgi:DNA-binding PadR family transcriptional regulator